MNLTGISEFTPLGEFKNVKYIEFGTTSCTMTIKDLKGIQEVKQLEILVFMCKTKIKTNIEEISKLSKLKSLGLYNLMQEIPEDLIKPLNNLEFISLSKQNYASIKGFPRNLKEVQFSVSDMKELPKWEVVDSVKIVDLGICKFENIDSLCCFPNLEEIVFFQVKSLIDISYVKSLPALKKLSVNFSPINSLSGFYNHKAIEEIKARGSHILGVEKLGVLPSLKVLYLEKSKLKSIEGIKNIFPNLELLWIWGTKVKDLSPLEEMTSLKELDVTLLKPKSWDFLTTLHNLGTLNLSATSFSDTRLLMELPNLKNLVLFRSEVDMENENYKKLKELIETRGGEIK